MKTYKILDTRSHIVSYTDTQTTNNVASGRPRSVLNLSYLRGSSFIHISVKDTKQRVPLRERLVFGCDYLTLRPHVCGVFVSLLRHFKTRSAQTQRTSGSYRRIQCNIDSPVSLDRLLSDIRVIDLCVGSRFEFE